MFNKDDLPRDTRGVRLDVEGKRDKTFSNWHRKYIKRGGYSTDVDFIEYRFVNGILKVIAIIEVKRWYLTQPKYVENSANFKAIKDLAQRASVPFFHIWYECIKDSDTEIKMFRVWDVFNEEKEKSKEMNPEDFKKFIDGL